MNDESFLTLEQVAEKLQVSQRSVRRWIDAGELKAVRLGAALRISSKDLQVYVDSKRS